MTDKRLEAHLPTLRLLGLPGAGRKRFKQRLTAYLTSRTGDSGIFFEKSLENADSADAVIEVPQLNVQGVYELGKADDNNKHLGATWCVIDMRSPPEACLPSAMAHLEALLRHSQAIVWQFAESADLTTQTAWHQWLKKQTSALPAVHCIGQHFAPNHPALEYLLSSPSSTLSTLSALPEVENYQVLKFQLPKVVLEHLLFSLDASRQNLGLALWRVKGSVMTQEYVNPVAIEGTPARWDTYASELSAEAEEMGKLIIAGQGVNIEILLPLLQASVAMGEAREVAPIT